MYIKERICHRIVSYICLSGPNNGLSACEPGMSVRLYLRSPSRVYPEKYNEVQKSSMQIFAFRFCIFQTKYLPLVCQIPFFIPLPGKQLLYGIWYEYDMIRFFIWNNFDRQSWLLIEKLQILELNIFISIFIDEHFFFYIFFLQTHTI
jgi:hypothetical protein